MKVVKEQLTCSTLTLKTATVFCFERLARLIAGKNGCMHELKLRKAVGKELYIGTRKTYLIPVISRG